MAAAIAHVAAQSHVERARRGKHSDGSRAGRLAALGVRDSEDWPELDPDAVAAALALDDPCEGDEVESYGDEDDEDASPGGAAPKAAAV